LQTNGRTIVAQNWDGERDTTMTIIRLDDIDERPIATIVGYGTHPIVLAHQNRMISPDYPGTVKRTVEEIVVAPACSCRAAPATRSRARR